jgi:hypothetical protein
MKPAHASFLPASVKLIHVCLLLFAKVCFAADPKGKSADTNSPALDNMGYPKELAAALTQGQNEARRDLTNGVLKIKFGGLPGPHFYTYCRLLEERCKIKFDGVCGCVGTEGAFEYIKGYNAIARARICEKFGTNIFDQIYAQAETEDATTYEVRPGDTLLKIARYQGITLKALLAANPKITSPKINVGQKLVIPAAETSKKK